MKKLCCLLVLVLFIPFSALAQTAAESTANSHVYIDQSNNSSDTIDYGSRDYSFPYLGRMDSSSTFGLQPLYNLEKLGDMRGLPADWAKMGWRILEFPDRLVQEGIPMEVLNKSRASWLRHRATDTGYPIIESSSGRVYPVNFYPKDGSGLAVRHAKAYTGKEKYLPIEAQYESIYHGAKSGGKFFVVLYNIHYVSATKNMSLGTTMVGNAVVGPSDEPGKRLLSGGGGSGIGSAQSWVWERGGYWTIFFDKKPVPDIPVTKAEPQVQRSEDMVVELTETNQTPRPVPQTSEVRKAKIPSVMFDYDSAVLRSDQVNVINAISDNIFEMSQNLIATGQVIRVIGGASREGAYDHNLRLSDNRARTVHRGIAQRLYQRQMPAEVINQILRHSATGANYPDFDKKFPDERNRRVFVVIEDRLTE